MFIALLMAMVLGGAPPEDVAPEVVAAAEMVESDPVEARRRAERLAESGDAHALNLLGTFALQGIGGPADAGVAADLFARAEAAGSRMASINLAQLLLLTDDPAGHVRAITALRRVEDDPELAEMANYAWGRAYLFGWGVDQDLARGTAALDRYVARHSYNADAVFLLARAYQNGWGTAPDPARSFVLMRQAAEAGDMRARWNLGMMLLEGNGVAADPREAARWVRLSADQGYIDAMISRAVMLALGQGVAADPVEARDWYRRAAEQGSAHGLRGLGFMLARGEGGAVDVEAALAYLELAKAGGDDAALALLDSHLAWLRASANRTEVDRIKAKWRADHPDRP